MKPHELAVETLTYMQEVLVGKKKTTNKQQAHKTNKHLSVWQRESLYIGTFVKEKAGAAHCLNIHCGELYGGFCLSIFNAGDRQYNFWNTKMFRCCLKVASLSSDPISYFIPIFQLFYAAYFERGKKRIRCCYLPNRPFRSTRGSTKEAKEKKGFPLLPNAQHLSELIYYKHTHGSSHL